MINREQGKGRRLGRFVGRLFAAAVICGAFAACGGGQMVPPDNGTCNPGREWVSPYQDEDGWHTGYCRDIQE